VGFTDAEVPNAWETPRSYTVPAAALHAGKNTVAVRVFSTAGVGGFTGTADQMRICQYDHKGDVVSLSGDWLYKPERIAQPDGPPPLAPIGPGSANAPGGLYNGMIAPVTSFTIKGVVWYQGEANVGRATQYRELFSTLIQDWRNQWGQPTMPFYFVQLPNYLAMATEPGDSQWAELREAQADALSLPNTGMATIIDLGDANDIHPKEKREVGRRLAFEVLRDVYKQNVGVASGPVQKTILHRGAEIWIRFESTGGGLKTTDSRPPAGFALSGADHKFRWATARIRGDWVILSSPDVPSPVDVRYAWADNPDVNLVNAAGLPAAPFRTDATPPGP
jgi:sialate O-acetylesterase